MGCTQQRCRTEPENEERHRQHDRCEQKAKTGKHGARKTCKNERTGTRWPLKSDGANGLIFRRPPGCGRSKIKAAGKADLPRAGVPGSDIRSASQRVRSRMSNPPRQGSESCCQKHSATDSRRSLNLVRKLKSESPCHFAAAGCSRSGRSDAATGTSLAGLNPGKNGVFGVSQLALCSVGTVFCLECAAIFGHLPLTIRCRLGAIQEE